MTKSFVIGIMLICIYSELLAQTTSKAELGAFPYFSPLPNFRPRNSSDSITNPLGRTYHFDGKKVITIDGKVSLQKVVFEGKNNPPSVFQLIEEYDKVIRTLGGQMVFKGKLPEDIFKKALGVTDLDKLEAGSLVGSYYMGIVEWVIKQNEKEVWLQLSPYTILSSYYSLSIVEKSNPLITGNINKKNQILEDLMLKKQAAVHIEFALDSVQIKSESGDEILKIVEVFQKNPTWKLKIEVHNAPLLKPQYVLELTQKRAKEIEKTLLNLGVKSSQLDVVGLGDSQPIDDNGKESGRLRNSRVMIIKI
ncbi:MAG: OmpA family protein [Leadbetterella sp.]